jgi:hypothetical protein
MPIYIYIYIYIFTCWLNAVVARQQEVKHISMDMHTSPVLLHGYCCMATKSGRPQQ